MSKVLTEYRLLAVLVGGSAMVALGAIPQDAVPRGFAVLGALVGLVYYLLASRRERTRKRLADSPFPDSWREILYRRVSLYSLLSPSEQERFEAEIKTFLGEQRIYPLGGDKSEFAPNINDETKILVAASAATLLLGRPEWRLPTIRDIVIYPTAFAEETYKVQTEGPYSAHPQAIGMVHAQGPILLSLDALEQSFPLNAQAEMPPVGMAGRSQLGISEPVLPHVGIHEFAHVLDIIASGDRPVATGVPGMLTPQTALRWHHQLALERERLSSGQSLLSPYGLKSEAELFAVSVESFFQDSLRMRVHHPDLYALLAEFFNQDPAARLVAHHAAFVLRPWFALGPTSRYTA